MPDLDRISKALGVTADQVVAIAGDTVTTADGVVHTFADPARFGLEDWARPAAPAKAKSDPAA